MNQTGELKRDAGDAFALTGSPVMARDTRAQLAWGNYLRQAASPGAAVTIIRMNGESDVRQVLPVFREPTPIVHRKGDRITCIEQARQLAGSILGARLLELPEQDHLAWIASAEAIFGEIVEFLKGVRQSPDPDRVLATVLFTDIVGATERAATLGDHGWRQLLAQHRALVRRELATFRGREIDTAGDGFLAAFDGPGRAVRCARAVTRAVRAQLDLEVRAGLHTGECELLEDKLAGLAVHIGARVAALAKPGEVLVSNTVKDLVAGSGLRFEDRGGHVLEGIPGEWRLFAAVATG